jgi:hypothetical protein
MLRYRGIAVMIFLLIFTKPEEAKSSKQLIVASAVWAVA